MAEAAVPYLLVIVIFLLLLVAFFAIGSWQGGSRSTRKTKLPAEPSIPLSDAQYAALRAEMAELYSTLEKLTTTVKRISSRHGMQALRERETEGDPPVGTSKADLLRHYGMSGKVGPAFAKAQLDRE